VFVAASAVAISPMAGVAVRVALGAPFLIAGALKSVYDIGMYIQFRGVELDDLAREAPAGNAEVHHA
jgi:hypothetical protein